MPLVLNGAGTIGGLSAGGLPSSSVTAANLASGAARTNFGAGGILQVVQTIPSPTAVATISNTYDTVNPTSVNTALLFSGSITPSSSASKILIELNGYLDSTAATGGETLCLFRSSTYLFSSYWYRRVANNETQPHIIKFLDSPGTTSAVQYDIRATSGDGRTLSINRNNNNTNATFWSKLVSLTLTEISG